MPKLNRSYFTIAVIRRNFLIIFISLSLMACFSFAKPTQAVSGLAFKTHSTLSPNQIATLNYEVKESTSLTDPITDPNFNVMRTKELGKSRAIPLVVGVLILAIVAPLATWWFFSK